MEKLLAGEIADAVKGKLVCGDSHACMSSVSTDSRSMMPGALFFALKGKRVDGHCYISAAIEAGAAGVVVSDDIAIPQASNVFVVRVADTLQALGDLAAYYRSKFNLRVVGVTGSLGKTTTKDMLASILSRKWRVLKNEANFNNEIGLPLTVFAIEPLHEVVVLEMAMRGLGEIRRLAQIARPSVGVVTNVGTSHIERLGSRTAIARAKSELLEELPPNGIAVINADDKYCRELSCRTSAKVVTFGVTESADVTGSQISCSDDGRCSFRMITEGADVMVALPILGRHNVVNALAAGAAAYAMGLELDSIRVGLENFQPSEMRMEFVVSKKGCGVLNDAYNANPESTLAALQTLHSIRTRGRRIAALGDMLELGDYAADAHKDVGAAIACMSIDSLVTVGSLSKLIAEGAIEAGFPQGAVQSCEDSEEAAQYLKNQVAPGDTILVKGSRAMRMEEIVRVLLDA